MIRGATRADLDALLALEAQFPSDQLSRRSFHHLLTRAQARVLVYQDGDTLAGNAVVLYRRGQHAARLYSLVVHPAFQRRGIAGALLRAAEHDAQQRGCAALRLEVRADNSAAARLYARDGYQELCVLPGYYDDGTAALRLHKPFAAVAPTSGVVVVPHGYIA